MDELAFPRKLFSLGDKVGALEELARLIQKDPRNIDTWLLLADMVDENAKKADCYRQVLRLDPENQQAQQGLKNIVRTGTADNTEAKAQTSLDNQKIGVIDDKMVKDGQDAAEYLKLPNDFSVNHLQKLEDKLKRNEKLLRNNPVNAKLREDVAIELIFLGIYFGEIYRKEIGGNWVFDPAMAKEQGTINETFLLLNKKLVDPFEPFFGRAFQGEDWGVIEYFQSMAEQATPGYSVYKKLSVSRIWMCPACKTQNTTKTKIRLQLNVTCRRCNQSFLYISGEVILAHCIITKYPLGEYCDWTLRLSLFHEDMKEIHFTLRSHEYVIAEGDYVIAFLNHNDKVVYLDNKATNTYVIPD
jgi:hypothetical protein